ncbi:snRNA-activating protein complex subunit 5-like [Gigantopelta aegis]|uniref:snRNA-activating protein complex subunit 5-like n=1 Tax=Gigantopelta aegis TaxID=1735272 RepID=UPI001B88B571|nr:snRNA-activating protein complex subunit 5-like [Gigantopelta aegis]
MSSKELQVLKEEEKTLINLHTKLSDQLNRLKVEELALITMIRLETGGNTSTETEMSTSNQGVVTEKENKQEELQLSVAAERIFESEEMEEEEEEEDEEDSEDDGAKQLMSFLEELTSKKT